MQTMIYYGENNKAIPKYYGTLIYQGYTRYYTKKSGTTCILHFLTICIHGTIPKNLVLHLEKTLKNVDISVTIPQNMVRKLHNLYLLWLKLTYYTKKTMKAIEL